MTIPICPIKGHGCPQCHKEKIYNARAKSNEDYINELKTKNPTIIPIEKYVNVHTAILHKCLLHNIEWETSPSVVLNGSGCPQCWKERLSKNKIKTHEQYVKDLAEIDPDIIVLEKYIKSDIKILHRCLIHNEEWYEYPSHILLGEKCPICSKEKRIDALTKKHEVYEKELKDKGIKLIPLEKYQKEKIKILHKCSICGFEWKIKPENVLYGKGCPNCNRSKGENKIKQWLIEHNIIFEPQKRFNNCKDVFSLPFDFYLPTVNKCIEYDGRQHFQATDYFGGQKGLEYIQRHDRIKNEYCENNNIPLLRIPYYADIDEELIKFLLN